MEPGDNEGDPPKEVYYGVPCRALERIGGYTLTEDDPKVFNDRITYVDHTKEFPEPYPEGADTDPAVPTASSSKQPSPSPSPKKSEMETLLSRMHYELHKLAKNAGIPDICAHEKATRIENVLAGLTSKDLVCRYCKEAGQYPHKFEESYQAEALEEDSTLLSHLQKVLL